MKQSELFKLACQCLLLDEHPGLKNGIWEKFVSGEVNLDAFILLCSNHFVLPAIYLRLKNSGLIGFFPNEYADHLKEIHQLNKKRNKEILAQIDEISSRVAKETIQPLYLKGTANLMDNLYSNLGDRMIGDIDFLVQEKDYEKTIELVKDLNYHSDVKMYDGLTSWKHYPRLFKKDVPADIEIHHVPVNINHSKQFNTELLFQNKKEIINTSNTFVSSNGHKLIHTFIHSQLSNKGYQYKIIGLRDLYDTHLLVQKVNPDAVLPQIEERKKAQVFFEYTKQLFSPEQNNSKSTNKPPNRFISQHQWFLNHPWWHRQYINILKLYNLIIVRYLIKIIKAMFQKSSLKYIYVRVKDPQWYRKHFEGIINNFKN